MDTLLFILAGVYCAWMVLVLCIEAYRRIEGNMIAKARDQIERDERAREQGK